MSSPETPNSAAQLDPLLEAGRLAAVGTLARDCAHEINNPLFAILVLVEFVLREVEEGSKAHERLVLIERSANDIKGVVERMHGFTRLRAGEPAPIALAEVAADAVDLLRHVSATRGVTISERYPEEPALVVGDANRLKLLFVNVLINAFQALPDGGTVEVAVEVEDGDVVAAVADSGSGFEPGSGGDPFALFQTTKGSAGIGLTAARSIAEQHGGTLEVDPEAPRGARLVLRLPETA